MHRGSVEDDTLGGRSSNLSEEKRIGSASGLHRRTGGSIKADKEGHESHLSMRLRETPESASVSGYFNRVTRSPGDPKPIPRALLRSPKGLFQEQRAFFEGPRAFLTDPGPF